jgi:hypothetical protein
MMSRADSLERVLSEARGYYHSRLDLAKGVNTWNAITRELGYSLLYLDLLSAYVGFRLLKLAGLRLDCGCWRMKRQEP